jgi:uroporphyrinogen-III synthase
MELEKLFRVYLSVLSTLHYRLDKTLCIAEFRGFMTHVLLTRPLEASRQLADQLGATGLTAIVMPLYTFSVRAPSDEFTSVWSGANQRRLAVFTSPRAVRFGLPHIPNGGLKNLEFVAIGSATRVSLEKAGHQVHLQSQDGYTSEDLLQVGELAVDPGEAIIFCAPGGREAIAKGLSELGWKVIKAMVYERVPLRPGPEQVDTLLDCEDLLSVWTSVSALELAREQLPAAAWKKILCAPVLVISDRIQHHLQQLGASRIELADGPGNVALLQSIIRLTGGGITD